MLKVRVVLGTWLADVTILSETILPAVILHGTCNVIGELPVRASLLGVGPPLGPPHQSHRHERIENESNGTARQPIQGDIKGSTCQGSRHREHE